LAGGRKKVEYIGIFDQRHYRKASLLVAGLHRSILGIPTQALPLKEHSGETSVYVQTQENRIFIVETGIPKAETEPTPLSPRIRQARRFWFLNP